jgi:hypothetical protein
LAKKKSFPIKFKTSLGKITISKEAVEMVAKYKPWMPNPYAPPHRVGSVPMDPTSFEPIADYNSLTKSWQCGCKVGQEPYGKIIKDCHKSGNHCYRRRQGG